MSGTATIAIRENQWAVEVATTTTELARGLSGRAVIPANTGMLFDLGSERIVNVNAYDMLFPISVVFIGEDLKVTGAVLRFSPGDNYTPDTPCRYFLEVNIGEVDDIAVGDQTIITGYTPASPMAELIGLAMSVMIISMMVKMMSKVVKEMK